ncbi:Enhancer of filamentation 1 [Bagarius yarrelli]|uniref:Breast cancer anti-estrogen resistance protein 1 n=1 Tax=Bagarius yarrelli TaxID=175774 RepID=A0A556VU12_BAGYA|nr:Enhancer of filamentation 1 [Bagarius yarrelli]
MAKALYDNVPESPEELAFRKGDILTVIEQNTGGLEGWWLCSLHGRQGIAPGNRLKLLITPMFEGSTASTPSASPNLAYQGMYHPTQGCQAQGIYQVPPCQDVYQVPQRSVLAAEEIPGKVSTPTRVGQTYVYKPAPGNSQELYDVPPMRTQGVYDIPAGRRKGKHTSSRTEALYDIPPTQDTRNQGVYDVPPPSQEVYSVPSKSISEQDDGNYDFPQPHKKTPEGLYDVPPMSGSKSSQSNYDFPPAHSNTAIYDIPPSQFNCGASQDLYDQQTHGRERELSKGIYDVLPPDSRLLTDVTEGINRLSFSSTGSGMSTSSSSAGCPAEGRLLLDLDLALQKLSHLQQGLESSLASLQNLASSGSWRTYGFAERYANEARCSMERVCSALAEFLAFGKGAAANATTLSDSALHSKLRKQLQRLEDSQQILQQSLENTSWPLATGKQPNKSDELDRFFMVAHTVPDDAKQLATMIGGSAELLFRRAPLEGIVHPFTCHPIEEESYSSQTKAFPVAQDSEQCVKSWMEDYDYVHLQGKEEFERQQKELLEKENIFSQTKIKLEQEQLNQFKQLEQEAIKPVDNDITHWISHQHSTGSSSSPSDSSPTSWAGSGAQVCGRDQQLLVFYGEQCEQHFVTLLNAVDAFFSCVATGQPPRIFVAHAKFVILSAHKLVFIGDTLSRQATTPDVANRVMDSSNLLCQLLKTVVGATKTAALHYPSTPAVQEMVDRVTDLSHHAQQFKMQLFQMAAV